jgi:hypothetical protein
MSEIRRIQERESEEAERGVFYFKFCHRKFCINNGWAEDKSEKGELVFQRSRGSEFYFQTRIEEKKISQKFSPSVIGGLPFR